MVFRRCANFLLPAVGLRGDGLWINYNRKSRIPYLGGLVNALSAQLVPTCAVLCKVVAEVTNFLVLLLLVVFLLMVSLVLVSFYSEKN